MRWLGLLVALGLMVSGPVMADETIPDVIRLGVLNDQSGPYSGPSGKGTLTAARMAVEDYGGKVLGRPVEVIVGDNQTKPDISAMIARHWMDEGVAAIIDGGSSAATLAVLGILKDKDRAFVFTSPAANALTNESCSPVSVQFTYDSYSLAKAVVAPTMKQGGETWFFITADYAAGASTQQSMTSFIEQAGGSVVGTVRHPIGASDYSSFLLQAQASRAKIIGLVNFAADLSNTLRQAAEFGIGHDGQQRFAIPLIFLTDVNAVGLANLPSLSTGLTFYWDMNDATRAFAKRFASRMNGQYPDETHAGAYSATLHLLKAMDAAGSISGKAVVEKMKAIPVNDFYNDNVKVREDGRVLHDFHLAQLKSAAESKGPYDFFRITATVPGAEVYQPLSASRCPLVTKK